MTQEDDKKTLQAMAIEHGIIDSPTEIAARNKFDEAFIAIADDHKTDAGMGFGEWNFWVKINGVEYFVAIKPPFKFVASEANTGEIE